VDAVMHATPGGFRTDDLECFPFVGEEPVAEVIHLHPLMYGAA
jgi:hypothetical protein